MFDYIVNHWQGLALAFAVFVGPTIPFLAWIGASELLDRAYVRGYDAAWKSAVLAQEHGKRIV